VTDVKVEEGDEEDGLCVRVTIMCGAGRPVVVSRTWHVIGSLDAIVEGFGRREEIASSRLLCACWRWGLRGIRDCFLEDMRASKR